MARIAAIEDLGDTCRVVLSNDVALTIGCPWPVLERHLAQIGTSPLDREAVYSVNQLTSIELRLCCRMIADKLPPDYAGFAERLRRSSAELLAEPHRLLRDIAPKRPLFRFSHPYHFEKTGTLFAHHLDWQGRLFRARVDLAERTVRLEALGGPWPFLDGGAAGG